MDDETPLFGITPEDWARTPESVQLAFGTLLDMVKELTERVRVLEAKLAETSRNSSKPPSSDPPSAPPPPPRPTRGRPRGAQPGHADQHRPLLPPDQVDQIVALHPRRCPACQTRLARDLPDAQPPHRHQVIELVPRLVRVTEYQQHLVDCPGCGAFLIAPLPPDLPPGLCGPRLTALVGLLHGRYRLSVRETTDVLATVVGVDLSPGAVVTSCTRVSTALAPVDAAIHDHLTTQDTLWVDETGWREEHRSAWLWVAVSPQATCFRIDHRRNRAVLRNLLGAGFRGIVHSDRGSAYHLLPADQRQLCWAHLVRNFQGLIDQRHAESVRVVGMQNLAYTALAAWRWARNGVFDQVALQQALLPVRLALHERLLAGRSSPWERLRVVCHDLLSHWDALWTFSRVEGVEPTNNVAERALRPAVVWRKTCFGTQSALGSRFVERLFSVVATARQQGRDLFAFLTDAVRASFTGQPPPVLV
jgi:transposase